MPVESGISAQALSDRIDQFLASRGYTPPASAQSVKRTASGSPDGTVGRTVSGPPDGTVGRTVSGPPAESAQAPAAFVCEEDVRVALRAGQKLVIGDKTIVTPAARDLGEATRIFVQAGWPR